ncbi:MogA/MoaB family molybdenum cofactor biosynthesis protein [Virgibacillus sp. 179-BFC.A HS]|uniref:Molybdenum cofactor biosynthesis protein B n=1 Tax=Tigheibacillus jepli TaxID=3035914 RepID=A0ABU5CG85_9BACI|nr:MogA/MoaB family molybdenum cofactor biosynthesis protein [Virgibacillus sp. 179-BFC.A HS]MDY0405332.1 MogA/MoaB family molybdenum cofactor biosynthesis protein [Virgibacillus sp. 179-BFC.A HS]
MAIKEHKQHVHAANCIVITVSDTRTEDTDKSGKRITSLLTENGHYVKNKRIVPDEMQAIRQALTDACKEKDVDAVILNGGTGIAKRDVTIEAVSGLLEKEIPGFGEIFRLLSFQEDIGSAAILSRAIAGIFYNTIIFSVPGSSGAVTLAMNRLILPELSHILHELRKDLTSK